MVEKKQLKQEDLRRLVLAKRSHVVAVEKLRLDGVPGFTIHDLRRTARSLLGKV